MATHSGIELRGALRDNEQLLRQIGLFALLATASGFGSIFAYQAVLGSLIGGAAAPAALATQASVQLAGGVASARSRILGTDLAGRLRVNWGNRIGAHVLESTDISDGDRLDASNGQLDVASSAIGKTMPRLVTDGAVAVSTSLAMMILSPILSAVMFAGVGLSFLAARAATRRTQDLDAEETAARRHRVLVTNARFSENGAATTRALDADDAVLDEYQQSNEVLNRVDSKRARLVEKFGGLGEASYSAGMYVAIAMTGLVAATAVALPAATIVAFMSASAFLLGPMIRMPQNLIEWRSGKQAIKALCQVVPERPGRTRPRFDRTVGRGQRIEIRGLSISLRGTRIIDNFSMLALPGELTVITGTSGAGKSTLRSVLMGDRSHSHGLISVDGHVRNTKGVFNCALQDPAFGPGSILDNARDGRPGATLDEVQAKFRTLGLHDLVMRKGGYDTELDTTAFSGGELRRFNVARALIAGGSCYFFDEPTSNLDGGSADLVISCLRDLAREGNTVIATSHSSALVSVADNHFHIRNPQLTQSGQTATPRDFSSNHGVSLRSLQ